jgi:hypothetical protein
MFSNTTERVSQGEGYPTRNDVMIDDGNDVGGEFEELCGLLENLGRYDYSEDMENIYDMSLRADGFFVNDSIY